MSWKLYIDSPQQRALDLCGGSLTEGGGLRGGYGWGGTGDGWGYGNGRGDGVDNDCDGWGVGEGYSEGNDYGWVDGDGRSANRW